MSWPSHCRSTPELDQLQAHLSALMSYRVAAGVLGHLLPVEASTSLGTFRHHTLKIGEQLRDAALAEAGDRGAGDRHQFGFHLHPQPPRRRTPHLEVRVGNVETACGGRQVFGAVAESDTDITTLISRNLEAVGRTDDSDLTAFTDGCSGLRVDPGRCGRDETTGSRLVSYRDAASTREAGGEFVVDRRTGPDGDKGVHYRAGRAAALADLERQREKRPDHDRAAWARVGWRARSATRRVEKTYPSSTPAFPGCSPTWPSRTATRATPDCCYSRPRQTADTG